MLLLMAVMETGRMRRRSRDKQAQERRGERRGRGEERTTWVHALRFFRRASATVIGFSMSISVAEVVIFLRFFWFFSFG